MAVLDENYWSCRYKFGKTGWDIGYPSPPIVQYLDQIENKEVEILIPGAGNAYEAIYAFNNGFKKVHVLDFSTLPLEKFKGKVPSFPIDQIHLEDFFLHQGKYDLIIEQTFFCALEISLRKKYVEKMYSLLKPQGVLMGVLFNRDFDRDGPPFGGTKEEYESLFKPRFDHVSFSPCDNSIPERMGSELFFTAVKSNG
ncbi:SAM-dependent methyltransferase [Algoriphagus iocasae]|jgi:methyl halide transferase|uniref:SAM-dependent methyltransferase n=1 Tax=Algoriphagus iocasae TaxID=1836499 RepID=A0A841MKD6_9BACT|nr:methyltransferase domain-containing protein [Algoriphagus iocasae]MBB6328762.1 SAM-dependent methyltransferase [Algoriphagus iocasae]